MESILQLKNVNKTYAQATFCLKDITFSIPYGSIVGFIGENGAGKTTTMGTILRTLKKDSGTINVLGKNIETDEIAIKKQIGVVLDEMNFSSNLHVDQLSSVLRNIYQAWDEEKYNHYIDLFSLPRKKKIEGFSRGMSMKLSLAVALSHNAKLLILDEATAGLDPVAREEVLDILDDYVTDERRSIFLSSHITTDIEKIADELIFIKKGEILLHVNKDEMMSHYAIVTCDEQQLKQLDERLIVAYVKKTETIEVLVSNKKHVPPSFQMKTGTLDDRTLLLMKGEFYERSHT